jgi:hypothetical protein
VEICSLDAPPHGLVASVRRCEVAGTVEEQRRRTQRPASPRVVRSSHERIGDLRVRLRDAGGELPRSSLWIVEQLGEPPVDLVPPEWIPDLVRPGREQRVREPDAVAVELDESGLERRHEPGLARNLRRGLGERDCRMRVCRSRQQELAALARKGEETSTNEVVERLGDRQRVASLDRDVRSLQHAQISRA